MTLRNWPQFRLFLLVLVLPTLALASWMGFCLLFCPTGTSFEFRCRYSVRVGMPIREAESVLGPAEQEPGPPCEQGTGPVVTGDEFFVWESDGMEFHIGVRDGRITGKWFWAPSL